MDNQQMVKRGAILLSVKEKTLRAFIEVDPFNEKRVAGVICRNSDNRYGAMVFFSVDDKPCEQIIWCTPKLEYPFDHNGNYHWPDIHKIEVWNKLDGTNVLSYHYEANGKQLRTYKTRLSPFIKNGNYGGFYSMWCELLERYTWIEGIIEMNPLYNLLFEMYGARNPILIEYDVPLDTALLFAVDSLNSNVVPPTNLKLRIDANTPERIRWEEDLDITDFYEKAKIRLEEGNKDAMSFEGLVFYASCGVKNSSEWRMFKCKPSDILKIHWGNSAIPRRELWNTAMNSFEDGDPTMDHFRTLLLEEYTEHQLGRSEQRIARIFEEAKNHAEKITFVNKIWQQARKNGLDVLKDKNKTFRFMSDFFDKSEMQMVASIILKQAGNTEIR